MTGTRNSIVPSASRDADGNSGPIQIPPGASKLALQVDASAVTGTSPTLDIDVEWAMGLRLGAAIGNPTFAESTDRWSLTSHGLVVGDTVQFTAAGTGADGYAADTTYHVVNVVDANTFQLSESRNGAVLTSTANSSGTWTIAKHTGWTPATTPDDFTQLGAAGQALEVFDVKAPLYRLVFTFGGTTPDFTFAVHEHTT